MKVRTLAALTGVVALTVGGATAVTANDPDAHAVRPDAGPVVVQDVEIAVPGQQPTRAYLVRPAHPSRDRSLAGILYLHWLEPPDVTQNRTEFLDEAIQAAQRGAVALLPDRVGRPHQVRPGRLLSRYRDLHVLDHDRPGHRVDGVRVGIVRGGRRRAAQGQRGHAGQCGKGPDFHRRQGGVREPCPAR